MLRISLLGGMALEVDGGALELPASRRLRSLLAWLALHPGMQPRSRLAARFWPDVLDTSARGSLRNAVLELRRALAPEADRYLITTRDAIGLGPDEEVWVDVRDFERAISEGRPRDALALGEDELLPELDDDWVFEAREAHTDALAGLLVRMAVEAEEADELAAAVEYARRLVGLDPLGEEPARRLMRLLAGAGESAAAVGVYERLRERLRTDLKMAPSAVTRELAEEVRAGPTRAAGTPAEVPLIARATNLPDELTSFVGRSAELARVRELLGQTRLLTLVGAGGCGKTRLALQSAAGAVARFPDGAWWVELAALEDADLLAGSVSSALGLGEHPGQAPQEVLRDYLRDRDTLLVLDNCEHLLGACAALVDSLLGSCPGLVVLATSREAMGVPGELPYRVPSLTVPAELGSLAEVMHSDAVRLFSDRAVHARANFAVTEGNASAVTAICRELDGMPLAIELAAARVRMLSPDRIAKELDGRLRLLTGGGRTVAARHETLRESIHWSHELCSEQERLLLRRLSVWAGGFTLEGAEAVSADETLDRRAVLEPLTGLVDRSLVDTEQRGDEIRLRMLETIRQYAAERLDEAGEVDAVRARHLAWCLELAERAEPELVRHDAGTWLSRLEPEAANLRSALEWARAGNGEAALRLAAALTFFWFLRGRLEEGTAALARVLEGAPQPTATRGKALWGLAELSARRGEFGACLGYAKRAFEDGEAAGDRGVRARALKAQGQIGSVADHAQGRATLERSVELASEAGDEWCTADATRLLAATYVRQSEHDLARPMLEDCYARARALGYRPLYAAYFNLRAWGELEHGRLRGARELAEQATNEIAEAVTIGLATALLIECDVLEGVPARARARAEPYMERMRTAGVGPAQVWADSALALADVAEGSLEVARARLEAILRAIDGRPSYHMEGKARRRLAVVLRLLDDLDGAEGEACWLLSQAESGGNEYLEAIAHHLVGRVALRRGEANKAEGHLHEALAVAKRRDFRLQTLNSLESLAHVAALSGSPAEAARLLAAVRASREQSGMVRWPQEPELWARVEAHVRAELGEDAFATSWAEGAALSVDAAVRYATRARGKRGRPLHGWESLTPTEVEVMRHTAGGLTNPQIGQRMFISPNTVKTHLSHIFAKLGLFSRTELAAEAAKRGSAPGRTPAAADERRLERLTGD